MKEKYSYKTSGVCAKVINFEIKDDKVYNLEYIGGCPGNRSAISSLVEGMQIDEIINKLKGIDCSERGTSCPDQFSKALEEIKSEK